MVPLDRHRLCAFRAPPWFSWSQECHPWPLGRVLWREAGLKGLLCFVFSNDCQVREAPNEGSWLCHSLALKMLRLKKKKNVNSSCCLSCILEERGHFKLSLPLKRIITTEVVREQLVCKAALGKPVTAHE